MIGLGYGKVPKGYVHRQLEGGIDITGREDEYLRGDKVSEITTNVATIITEDGVSSNVHPSEVVNELVRIYQTSEPSFKLEHMIGTGGTVTPMVILQLCMITKSVVVQGNKYSAKPNPVQLKILSKMGAEHEEF